MSSGIPDRSIRICADRGGTFCDVHAQVVIGLFYDFACADCMHSSYPDSENPNERKEVVVKLCESNVYYFNLDARS